MSVHRKWQNGEWILIIDPDGPREMDALEGFCRTGDKYTGEAKFDRGYKYPIIVLRKASS